MKERIDKAHKKFLDNQCMSLVLTYREAYPYIDYDSYIMERWGWDSIEEKDLKVLRYMFPVRGYIKGRCR